MKEQWERWIPIEGLSKHYEVDAILDTLNGLSLILSDDDNNIKMIFKNSVEAYRSTNESYWQSNAHYLHEEYGSAFCGDWAFFKVTNSEYLQWLSKESNGLSDSLPLIHFALLGTEYVLEIIACDEPTIEFLNKRKQDEKKTKGEEEKEAIEDVFKDTKSREKANERTRQFEKPERF